MLLYRSSPKKIVVACPSCGFEQKVYAASPSMVCRACGEQSLLHKPKPATRNRRRYVRTIRREIRCYQCGHLQTIPEGAGLWQCTNCGTGLDQENHRIRRSHTANIHTYGGIHITSMGRFLGAKAEAEWIRLAGQSVGTLLARESLTLEGRARLRAPASGGHLEVAAGAVVEIDQPLAFTTCRISGRLKVRQLSVSQKLDITATGVLQAGSLVFRALSVEPGGVLRGRGATLERGSDSVPWNGEPSVISGP
jgi:ribosomal protein S27E/cytoskeletal protein CcmA (bactofilin family)